MKMKVCQKGCFVNGKKETICKKMRDPLGHMYFLGDLSSLFLASSLFLCVFPQFKYHYRGKQKLTLNVVPLALVFVPCCLTWNFHEQLRISQ